VPVEAARHPRPGLRETSLDALAGLKPVLEDACTPRSSSQISDGAAAVLLMDSTGPASWAAPRPRSWPSAWSVRSRYYHLDGPVRPPSACWSAPG